LMFQLPWLPEAILGRRGATPLAGVLRRSTRPGAVTREELRVYRKAYLQPGALTAMLSWYRAAGRLPSARLAHPQLQMPTCLIWGKKDDALGWDMAAPSIARCDDGRLFLLEDAGHFVQLDEPSRVAELLLDFFGPA
jgi:pimeloyl-ACP methyl ester carboxylesterase